jgi:serine/threonine protein kinase
VSSPERPSPLRVAVVDDSDLMRALVRRVLEKRGHKVSTYADGRDALEGFARELPDVVVSDLNMPRMTGDELCAALAAKHGLSGPPVIMLSTADDEESISKALIAGCVHYVKKPFDGPHLCALVENAPRSAGAPPRRIDERLERLGPYRLHGLLGKGGMGVVYRAVRDDRPDVEVALKVGIESSLGHDTERFLRELELLGSLDHPGIARLLDTGAAEGHIYYAMELIRGRTLEEDVTARGPSPWPRIAAIGRDVGAALAYVHEHEVVHRDIKPANILLAEWGPPRLIDFGLARRPHDPALTDRSEIVGTAHYLAPELLDEAIFTPASDVFAFGVALYEALLGRHPVTDEVGPNVAYEINAVYREGRVPRVRSLRPDCPAELALVIERTLEPQPSRRPPCSDVATALRVLLEDPPSP